MAGGAADCQFWHRKLGIKVYLCFYTSMHICVHCPLINLFNIMEFPPQLCYYLLMEYFTSYQFHPIQYCLQ